jgi:hypothetical protein
MKIAIVENYYCKRTYIGRYCRNDDEMYGIDCSYTYTFYSDSKSISVDQYRIIDKFLKSFNKSSHEILAYSVREETHQLYDIEKSNELASKLGCQIFDQGVLPVNLFQHKVYPIYCGIFDADKSPIWKECNTEITEHKTLPVIKYMKLIKSESYMYGRIDNQYWRCEDLLSDIRIDDDCNLCCENRYDVFRISVLLADRIYIPYHHYEKNISSEQSSYAIIIKDNQYGVIDIAGDIIVKYQKYKIVDVYSTFCIVEYKANHSCINFAGEILMPFTFQEFHIYYSRYAEVIYDNLKLIYDLELSKLILNANYKDLVSINDNFIIVKTHEGLIDLYNLNSLKINDESIESIDWSHYLMFVCKSRRGWIVYDMDGNVVFVDTENKYSSIKITEDEHISLKQKKDNNYHIYGLANSNGRIIFPCYSDSPIKVFKNDGEFYYILKKYNKQYLCNSNGQIISAKYDLIMRGREGICIAYEGQYTIEYDGINYMNDKFYALSLDGKVKFSIRCQNLFSFRQGLATIKQNGKFGKVNINGEIIIPPMYDKIGIYRNGLIAVRIDSVWGYIDINNNIVIDVKYDRADDFDEKGEAYVELNGCCARINALGEHIEEWEREPEYSTSSYDSIDEDTYIRDGIAEAFNDDPTNYWNID